MKRVDVRRLRRAAVMALAGAALYMLADIPVQATHFLRFGSAVGIKNALPPVLGLLLGPAGTVGCAAGSIAGALVLGTLAPQMAGECLSVLVCGLGMWAGWFAKGGCQVLLKKPAEYRKYALLLAAASAAAGAVWYAAAGSGALALGVAYAAMGLLVDVPILILAGSIFCIEPVLPPGRVYVHQVTGCVTAQAGSIGAFNDLLEEKLLLTKKVNMKRLFELQNVVEEVALRVLAAVPDAAVEISVDCHDTCPVCFRYRGARFDPLKMRRDEDEVDLMSLKLIRHRALRASHAYSHGENTVRVVV